MAFVAQAYEEHGMEIFRYLLSRTRDVERAEDLTQDVFLAAVSALTAHEDDPRPLLPWLYAVARHRYAGDVRKRLAEPGRVPLEAAEPMSILEPDYDPPIVPILTQAFHELSPAQRRICAMRLFEGRSFAEIRDELEKTEPACRMQFTRGLKVLRKALRRAGLSSSLIPL